MEGESFFWQGRVSNPPGWICHNRSEKLTF
jgi:hypothetical protein